MFGKKKTVLHAREILALEIARTALNKWALVKDNTAFEFGAIEIAPDKDYFDELRVSGYGSLAGQLVRFDMLVMNTEREPEPHDGYRWWAVLEFSVQPKKGPLSRATLVKVGKSVYSGQMETGIVIGDTSIGGNQVVREMEASSKKQWQ